MMAPLKDWQLNEELQAARAEIERLQERYDFQVDANRSLVEAIATSEADNARLRAALKEISEFPPGGYTAAGAMAIIARAALEPKP